MQDVTRAMRHASLRAPRRLTSTRLPARRVLEVRSLTSNCPSPVSVALTVLQPRRPCPPPPMASAKGSRALDEDGKADEEAEAEATCPACKKTITAVVASHKNTVQLGAAHFKCGSWKRATARKEGPSRLHQERHARHVDTPPEQDRAWQVLHAGPVPVASRDTRRPAALLRQAAAQGSGINHRTVSYAHAHGTVVHVHARSSHARGSLPDAQTRTQRHRQQRRGKFAVRVCPPPSPGDSVTRPCPRFLLPRRNNHAIEAGQPNPLSVSSLLVNTESSRTGLPTLLVNTLSAVGGGSNQATRLQEGKKNDDAEKPRTIIYFRHWRF